MELNYERQGWIYLGEKKKEGYSRHVELHEQRLADKKQLVTLFQNGQRERCDGTGREWERQGQRRKKRSQSCVLI